MKTVFTYTKRNELFNHLKSIEYIPIGYSDLSFLENNIKVKVDEAVNTLLKYTFISFKKVTINIKRELSNPSAYVSIVMPKCNSDEIYLEVSSVNYIGEFIKKPVSNLDNVWIHELAHALDLNEISEGTRKIKCFESDHNYLLKILMTFQYSRAEGIARLLDFLLEQKEQTSDIWTINAKNTYKGFWDLMYSKIELIELENETIQYLETRSFYHLGKFLVINSIYFKHKDYRTKIEEITKRISLEKTIPNDVISIKEWIEMLVDLKLEEFLYGNIQTNITLPYPILNGKDLLRIFTISLRKKDYSPIKPLHLLLKILDRSVLVNEDFKDFEIEELSEQLIFQKYTETLQSPSICRIQKELLTSVYQKWEVQQNEMYRNILLYVFSPHTVYPEELPILSTLDKMIALSYNS